MNVKMKLWPRKTLGIDIVDTGRHEHAIRNNQPEVDFSIVVSRQFPVFGCLITSFLIHEVVEKTMDS